MAARIAQVALCAECEFIVGLSYVMTKDNINKKTFNLVLQ